MEEDVERWFVVLKGQVMYSGKDRDRAKRLMQQRWPGGKIVLASDGDEAVKKAG